MILQIEASLLEQIHAHGEAAYPEEGAGFLLGETNGESRRVVAILPVENAREESARHHRYSISPRDIIQSDEEADRLGLQVIGVFHSHPNHPNRPSEFDRQHAWPWWSYVITSVMNGKVAGSRSWRLVDDRSDFEEEDIEVLLPDIRVR